MCESNAHIPCQGRQAGALGERVLCLFASGDVAREDDGAAKLQTELHELLASYQGKGLNGYDALVMFSGGKDSCYLMHRLKTEYPNLRPLAMLVDNSFLSKVAVMNAHDAAIEAERRQAAAAAPPVDVVMGRINALLAFDRRAGLSRIQTPTLVVASDNDYVIPSYHAEALARAIPGARLAILPGGGHANTATQPEAFNRVVLEFLSG